MWLAFWAVQRQSTSVEWLQIQYLNHLSTGCPPLPEKTCIYTTATRWAGFKCIPDMYVEWLIEYNTSQFLLPNFILHIYPIYMFQTIIIIILILDKDNLSKYKMLFLKDGFID